MTMHRKMLLCAALSSGVLACDAGPTVATPGEDRPSGRLPDVTVVPDGAVQPDGARAVPCAAIPPTPQRHYSARQPDHPPARRWFSR